VNESAADGVGDVNLREMSTKTTSAFKAEPKHLGTRDVEKLCDREPHAAAKKTLEVQGFAGEAWVW
jgi:hypothetical protein